MVKFPWVGCCLGLLCSGMLAAETPLPEVQRDWQLPYAVGDDLIAYADTRGTHVSYTDGDQHTLLRGGRGFPPVMTEDRIYATSIKGDLLAWDRTGRVVLWQRRFEGWVFPPLVIGHKLYLAGQAHTLHQLDAGTGATLATVPLVSEAIFSPVVWQGDQVAVGVYARQWQVIKRDPLRLATRFEVPEPPITGTPDNKFLAQSGSLHQRNPDGTFVRLVDGQGSVRWLDTQEGRLYWSTGRKLWRSGPAGIECLEAESGITHVETVENGYRLQDTNFYGTSRTLFLSHNWDYSLNNQRDKEKNDEKNVDRPDRDVGQQSVGGRSCRTLRHQ